MKNSSFRLKKKKQLGIKWNPKKKKTDTLKTMENVSAVREKKSRNKKWNDFW